MHHARDARHTRAKIVPVPNDVTAQCDREAGSKLCCDRPALLVDQGREHTSPHRSSTARCTTASPAGHSEPASGSTTPVSNEQVESRSGPSIAKIRDVHLAYRCGSSGMCRSASATALTLQRSAGLHSLHLPCNGSTWRSRRSSVQRLSLHRVGQTAAVPAHCRCTELREKAVSHCTMLSTAARTRMARMAPRIDHAAP